MDKPFTLLAGALLAKPVRVVAAGLGDIHTRVITVERTSIDFDDFWTTVFGGGAPVSPSRR